MMTLLPARWRLCATELIEVEEMVSAMRLERAHERAVALVAKARKIDHLPVQVDALMILSDVHEASDRSVQARDLLREAALLAERAHDDRFLAEALIPIGVHDAHHRSDPR